jgi:16S rRNA (cytidine1402-2'-O)-methyltransferase
MSRPVNARRRKLGIDMSDGEFKGRLFIVATPIGNLEDITRRAVNVLMAVPIVAAEDTRRSRYLLTHLGASPERLLSLHDHNESMRTDVILGFLRDGSDVALVSDPGFELVRAAHAAGIKVVPIPGPSAVMAAVSVSPLPIERFYFEGFLPPRRAQRRRRLAELHELGVSVVFFESPRRISDTLDDLGEVLGWDRQLVVAKELTKVHERIESGTVRALVDLGDAFLGKGEFVCVVPRADDGVTELGSAVRRLMQVLCEELPPAQAARLAAKATGAKRSALYDYAMQLRGRPSVD